MKEVFIWKGYGDIRVYSIDTPDQVEEVLETVYIVAMQNVYNEDRDKMRSIYEKNKDNEKKHLGLISWLIEEVGDDCDSFERGTGFYKVLDVCK